MLILLDFQIYFLYSFYTMKDNSIKVTVRKIKPVHIDKRGVIVDILEKVPVKHVGFISFEKGVVRANHYHKKQTQYTYVLNGEIKLVTKYFEGGKAITKITRSGDFVTIPPKFIHAYVALKKSSIIVLADYSRNMKSFEEDTFKARLV